jgi:hypothetical protein
MERKDQATSQRETARDIVIACIQSLNEEDFETARKYFNDDMSFEGVMGSQQGADAYFRDMEHMRLKYKVK